MNSYTVTLQEDNDCLFYMLVEADDYAHAWEQAVNAYSAEDIINIQLGDTRQFAL